MKVFKKVFAFAIALTAIAMASSAMAAETEKAVYDNGVVKVALADSALVGDDQTTVAVVDSHFGEGDPDVDDIYYIDQDTAAVIGAKLNTGVGLKLPTGTTFTPSTAEVRIGGANKSGYDTHTIPAIVPPTTFNEPAPVVDPETGKSTVGFDGTIVLNGATFNDIVFTLTSTEFEGQQFSWRASDSDVYTKTGNATINNLVGTVTFGLEIAGVSSDYEVDLVKIDVE